MNAIIKSQFSWCPLKRIFHNTTLKNKINRLHDKALRLVHRSKTSIPLEDLLKKKDETVNIHQRNLQMLAAEI